MRSHSDTIRNSTLAYGTKQIVIRHTVLFLLLQVLLSCNNNIKSLLSRDEREHGVCI